MPRAAMRLPQRRSNVSSTPITTGPDGAKVAASSPSSSPRHGPCRPARLVQHAMVARKAGRLFLARRAQGGADRAPVHGEQRTLDQHRHTAPRRPGEQAGERREARREQPGGHGRHRRMHDGRLRGETQGPVMSPSPPISPTRPRRKAQSRAELGASSRRHRKSRLRGSLAGDGAHDPGSGLRTSSARPSARPAQAASLPDRPVRPAGPLPRPGGRPGALRRRLRGDVARRPAAAPARARGPQRPRAGGAGAAVRLVPSCAASTAASGSAAGGAVGAVTA